MKIPLKVGIKLFLVESLLNLNQPREKIKEINVLHCFQTRWKISLQFFAFACIFQCWAFHEVLVINTTDCQAEVVREAVSLSL